MKNNSKLITFILVLFTITMYQCMGPNKGRYTLYDNDIIENVQIIGDWTSIASQWHFKNGGKLTIESQSETTNALWTQNDNTLKIIVNDEITVYNVDVLSDTKLKLSTADKEIILTR